IDASIATARTDIYALGVLSYEVLTGHYPFQGDLDALFKAHISEDVTPLGSSFPLALDKVIGKAMAKNPEDRYATAIEFASSIRKAAGMAEKWSPLPKLEETLRESLLASAPEPIAVAVANLRIARNPYQAREQIVELVRTIIHYI